jgi:endonuclease/exonuclease/phosphatase (EEP) superfamily protein YafD
MVVALCAGALIVLGRLPNWPFELGSHFLPLLIALEAAAFVWGAALKHRKTLILSALSLALGLWWLFPAIEAAAAPGGNPQGQLTVLSVNVLYSNMDPERLLSQIEEAGPDILLLVEINPAMLRKTLAGLPQYKYVIEAGPPAERTVLLTRQKPDFAEVLPLTSAPGSEIIHVKSCGGAGASRCIHALGLHAVWPVSPDNLTQRNAELLAAAELAARLGDEPVVMMGDLNCTPWSPWFDRMLTVGGLRRAASAGQLLTGTWGLPLPLIGLPIDHIVHTAQISAASYKVGGYIGSDHFPVIAQLRFH